MLIELKVGSFALEELSNVANLPIILHPGMRIDQLSFGSMSSPVERHMAVKILARSHYRVSAEQLLHVFFLNSISK